MLAVCLDGSPPAYHFDKGFGAGINNWLVHIEVSPFLTPNYHFVLAQMLRLVAEKKGILYIYGERETQSQVENKRPIF